MHCNWTDILSQHTLRIHSECTFRCQHCRLWERYPVTDTSLVVSQLKELLDAGTFFDLYPRTRRYNIVGGEPLIGPVIIQLLQFLKKAGIQIRVWTHGIIPDAHWESLYPWVDEIVLYCPSPDRTEYREITGSDGFEAFLKRIEEIKAQSIQVSINALVTPLLVEWLPYFHDISREFKVPLSLTYYPKDEFNTNEIEYIHRYNWVMGTTVFRLKKRHKTVCPSVPHHALQSPIAMGWCWGKQWIDRGRRYLNI